MSAVTAATAQGVRHGQIQRAGKGRDKGKSTAGLENVNYKTVEKAVSAAQETFKKIDAQYKAFNTKAQTAKNSGTPIVIKSGEKEAAIQFQEIRRATKDFQETLLGIKNSHRHLEQTDVSSANKNKIAALQTKITGLEGDRLLLSHCLDNLGRDANFFIMGTPIIEDFQETLKTLREEFTQCKAELAQFQANKLNKDEQELPIETIQDNIAKAGAKFLNEMNTANSMFTDLSPELINSDPNKKVELQAVRDCLSKEWSEIAHESFALVRQARIEKWSEMKMQLDDFFKKVHDEKEDIRAYKYNKEITQQGWNSYYYVISGQEKAFEAKYEQKNEKVQPLLAEGIKLETALKSLLGEFKKEESAKQYAIQLAKGNEAQAAENILMFEKTIDALNNAQEALYNDLCTKWSAIKEVHQNHRAQVVQMELTIKSIDVVPEVTKLQDKQIAIQAEKTQEADEKAADKVRQMCMPTLSAAEAIVAKDTGGALTFSPAPYKETTSLLGSVTQGIYSLLGSNKA